MKNVDRGEVAGDCDSAEMTVDVKDSVKKEVKKKKKATSTSSSLENETQPSQEKRKIKYKCVEAANADVGNEKGKGRRGRSKDTLVPLSIDNADSSPKKKSIPSDSNPGNKEEKRRRGRSKDARLLSSTPQNDKPSELLSSTPQNDKPSVSTRLKEKKRSKSNDPSLVQHQSSDVSEPLCADGSAEENGRRGRSRDTRLRPEVKGKKTKEKKRSKSKDASSLNKEDDDTSVLSGSNKGKNEEKKADKQKGIKDKKRSKSKGPSLVKDMKTKQLSISKNLVEQSQDSSSPRQFSNENDLVEVVAKAENTSIEIKTEKSSKAKRSKSKERVKTQRGKSQERRKTKRDKSKERITPKGSTENDSTRTIPSQEAAERRGSTDEMVPPRGGDIITKTSTNVEQHNVRRRDISSASCSSSDSSTAASFGEGDDKEDRALPPKAPEPRPRRGPNGVFLTRQASQNVGRILAPQASEDDIFAALDAEIDDIQQEKVKTIEKVQNPRMHKKASIEKSQGGANVQGSKGGSLSTQSEHISRPAWKPGQKIKAMDASELRAMLKLKGPAVGEGWKESRWFRDDDDVSKPASKSHGLSAFPVMTARPTNKGQKIVTKADGAAYRLQPTEMQAMSSKSKGRRSEIKDALAAFLRDEASFSDLNLTIH